MTIRTDSYGGFGAFLHPRVLAMLFLGFAAGLPYLLVFSTLTAWLADVGVHRGTVGMLAWVGLTYSLKFLWAPVVDAVRLPLLHNLLGRRRSWMLLAQLGIIAGLTLLSTTNPLDNVVNVALFALLASFSAATQDIAIDAWRIEAVEADRQAAMAANYQLGYRLGMLVSGAGALFLADIYDWGLTYLVMAACMAVGVLAVLLIGEPEYDDAVRVRKSVAAWINSHVLEPLADVFRRYKVHAVAILAFVALFRVSDYLMGSMALPFYLDMGYSKSEIAAVAKLYGTLASLVGILVGGVVVTRFGLRIPLIASAILLALTNLAFAALAAAGETDLWLLAGVITGDNFSAGLSGTAFITFLSSLTSRKYTATQYALLTSLMALPGKFMSGGSGFLSLQVGWVNFFVIVCLAGVPAIMLAIYVTRLKVLANPAPTDGSQGAGRSR